VSIRWCARLCLPVAGEEAHRVVGLAEAIAALEAEAKACLLRRLESHASECLLVIHRQ
jgi:hypothetical protein